MHESGGQNDPGGESFDDDEKASVRAEGGNRAGDKRERDSDDAGDED